MEYNQNFLTNQIINEKENKNQNMTKIKGTKSFVYIKGNKTKSNFNIKNYNTVKNIENNYPFNSSNGTNKIQNTSQLYINNCDNVEMFDEPKKLYNNKLTLKAQSAFFNKNKSNENSNKKDNYNEKLIDNEHEIPLDNKDKGNISMFEKDVFHENKYQYNNNNPNNSFCVSINNNYNYNFSLNNYNNKEDINWEKKLEIIKEQKRRMNKEFRYYFINNNNNENNQIEINKGENEHFKIKKMNSTQFSNDKNKYDNYLISFLKPFNNMNYDQFNEINNNYINGNINGADYKNNYKLEENEFKGRIKEFNDYDNNNENLIDDKFTFNVKKNNISDNNNELCELEIPAQNNNSSGYFDEKTAQFPDVINNNNKNNSIDNNINTNEIKDNKYINKNKIDNNKIYTKGRYDYLLLLKNKDIINNNMINTENSYNKEKEESLNKSNKNEIINGKTFTYKKNKNLNIGLSSPIKPKKLFKDDIKIPEKKIYYTNNNIEEIKLNLKEKRKKHIEKDKNLSFDNLSIKNRNNINSNFNENIFNKTTIDFSNNDNSMYNSENNNLNDSSVYSKPYKRKFFYQTYNDRMINEAYNKISKNNTFVNIKKNIKLKKEKFDLKNNFIGNKLYHINSFIVYQKRIDKKIQTKNKIEKNNNVLSKVKSNEKKMSNINKSNKKDSIINCKNRENIKKNINNKIFCKTNTKADLFLKKNINKKNYLKNSNINKNKFMSNNYLTPKKKNKPFINKINNIKIKVCHSKECRFIKYYNYFMKIPKNNQINNSVTKKNIIISKVNTIHKNEKISICYFTKKNIYKNIIKLPKKSICYFFIDRKNMYNNNKNENNLNNILPNDNIINEKKEQENKNEKNIKINSNKINNDYFLENINIMARKLTELFNKKNNERMKLNFNEENNAKNNLRKCKTYNYKSKIKELLSNEDLNNNNYDSQKKNFIIELNDIKTENLQKENNNNIIEEEPISSVSQNNYKKKRRRLGARIEEDENTIKNDFIANDNKNYLNNLNNVLIEALKEDLKKYYENNNNNNYDNSEIKLLLSQNGFNEIIKIIIKIYIDELEEGKNKDLSYYYLYIKDIIKILKQNEEKPYEIKTILRDICYICDLNKILYEILGHILFELIEEKIYFIEDLIDLIIKEKDLQNTIINIIKYVILSSGNKMKNYYNDFKALFKDNIFFNKYIENDLIIKNLCK